MNAIIRNADLRFGEISGTNGRQFVLELILELDDTGRISVKFNPMRLPQLLEKLGLEKFSELVDTPIKCTDVRLGEEVKGITNFMDRKNDWFETENSIYFGSEFFKGYGEDD